MSLFRNFNDGSQNPPRLQTGQSLWALTGLPMNAATPWTLEEKFVHCREAGFEHIEGALFDTEEGHQILQAIRDAGMPWALINRLKTPQQARDAVRFGAANGALWTACQPASAFHSLEEVAEIVRAGVETADENDLAFFVETHRDTFTENIPQTLQLIEAIPDIKMTADFSHFVVCGEFYGWEAEGAFERLQPITERVAHIHGRISNGQSVQVDVGDGSGEEGTPAHFFTRLWAMMFQNWRKTAQPGDVMPFTSELGPPRYAITLPDGSEFSDRWEQANVMRTLAQRAWAMSD